LSNIYLHIKNYRSILTAASSGHIKLWSSGSEDILNTGGHLERMRHSPYNRDIVATGGKSNDLKLWNIGAGYENVFKAKNVSIRF
jgi:ribosome biogenesis protein NSA1